MSAFYIRTGEETYFSFIKRPVCSEGCQWRWRFARSHSAALKETLLFQRTCVLFCFCVRTRSHFPELSVDFRFSEGSHEVVFGSPELLLVRVFNQIVNLFNMFITYGDTFLPTSNSYDELYYEIVRMHQVFDNLYCMGTFETHQYRCTWACWEFSWADRVKGQRLILPVFCPQFCECPPTLASGRKEPAKSRTPSWTSGKDAHVLHKHHTCCCPLAAPLHWLHSWPVIFCTFLLFREGGGVPLHRIYRENEKVFKMFQTSIRIFFFRKSLACFHHLIMKKHGRL